MQQRLLLNESCVLFCKLCSGDFNPYSSRFVPSFNAVLPNPVELSRGFTHLFRLNKFCGFQIVVGGPDVLQGRVGAFVFNEVIT